MASRTSTSRKPNLDRYYGRRSVALSPGEFEFRLTVLRPPYAPIRLDDVLESFEWTDEDSAMSGNLQLHRPDAAKRASLPIGRGHRVKCSVRWHTRWFELWTMRCKPPEYTVESNTLSVDLVDDLDLIRRTERDRTHRVTKRRKTGFYPHDMVVREARRDGVRVGTLARCRFRMSKVVMKRATLLEFVAKVYGHEHEKTGRRFVVRMHNGKLDVVPYQRNSTLYVLADQLRSAVVTQKPQRQNPPTVLTGRGRVGKGKAAKKVEHTEFRRAMVSRFGLSHKERDYGRVDSKAELRTKVRRDLAKMYRVRQSATVQVQGNPFLRRGDGCELDLASEGFKGDRRFVFLTAVRHQVQRGTYTTECDVSMSDPFAKDQRRLEKLERERKRKARKKREEDS